jgi:hypothetical protein
MDGAGSGADAVGGMDGAATLVEDVQETPVHERVRRVRKANDNRIS